MPSHPFYRALLADIADTEWQIVEQEFQDACARGEFQFPVQHNPHSLAFHSGGNAMADNKQNVGEPDRSRISTSEDYEVRDWAKSIGVSEDEIRRAVKAVGNSADAVRKFLGK